MPTPSENAGEEGASDERPDKARSLNEQVAACLAAAREKEEAGDARAAFLMCQSLVIDHYEDLEPGALASLYLTMARMSELQGKPERAEKYRQKAASLRKEATRRTAAVAPASAAAAASSPAAPPPSAGPIPFPPSPQEPTAGDVSSPQAPPAPAEEAVSATTEPAAAEAPLGAGGFPAPVYLAGFWVRLLALLVDVLLVGSVTLAAMAGASFLLGENLKTSLEFFSQRLSTLFLLLAVFLFFLLAYQTLFTVFGGQTAGKMLLRIKVVRLDGHTPGWPEALRRLAGLALCWLAAWAGFLWIGFDRHRRGWHDHLGQTMVVKLPRATTTSGREGPR